ncbi:hypothetical protein ACGF5O_32675, partial [Streptomyces sp. NPDC048291]|uniref:hypothetical protein n=1 Tax=Streptomyces sp. NPDC048291 TaxID=3365530 RepID=UPI003721F98F
SRQYRRAVLPAPTPQIIQVRAAHGQGSKTPTEQPLQVVVVEAEHIPGRPVLLAIEGPGVRSAGENRATAGEDGTVHAEVPVSAELLAPGDRRRISVTVEDAGMGRLLIHCAEFVAADPSRAAPGPNPAPAKM